MIDLVVARCHCFNHHKFRSATIMTSSSPLLLWLLMVISSSFLPARGNYPAVFNFGDSNSDTGGSVAGVAFPVGPPYGQTYFHKPSGRFSDGRLIVDFLMGAMDLPFLRPYLDSVGAPSFKKGTNFATAGATILAANANSIFPFPFGIQVAQFARFNSKVLDLLATGKKELRKYLPKEEYFHDGLYMLDVGQNDLYAAFFNKTEEQVIDSVPGILYELEIGIQKLYNLGARNFWIHNTGPLGCLARLIAASAAAGDKTQPDDVDQFGCLASRNRAATAFNSQLSQLCAKLSAQFHNASITHVDVYSVKLDLIANYSRYGFREPLAACCGHGGPPLNFDSRVPCGATVNVNGTMVTASACNGTSEYVNWDGTHYTEAANRFVVERLLTGNFSETILS